MKCQHCTTTIAHHHHHHHNNNPYNVQSHHSQQSSPSSSQQHLTTACCSLQTAHPVTNITTQCHGSPDQNGNRIRTLPNISMMAAEQCGQLGSFTTCTISLFVLSLVLIMIWSTVISTVLVTHSLKENESARNMLDLFVLYNDIGQLTFAIGKEMLNNLNTTVQDDNTQNITDAILERVSQASIQKGYIDFKSVAQSKLIQLRHSCLQQESTANRSFLEHSQQMVHCVREFVRLFYDLDMMIMKDNQWLTERHAKLTITDLSLRSMPCLLFVRGVMHRLTALGLGSILVRTNSNPHAMNMSEYYYYYYSSRQLIESAFVWNVRYFQKYLELEQSEYQTNLLVNHLNNHRYQEQENYLKMNAIFVQLFNKESVDRIRSLIKKKNVESVERLLVNESGAAKYIADVDANLVTIQLNSDLMETFDLEQLEQIVVTNQKHDSMTQDHYNLSSRHDQLIRNQINFMVRVQDFLNISIHSHLVQMCANEQHNLLYHAIIAIILILSVLFCFTMFLCTYFCARQQTNTCCNVSKSIMTRRARRRFWSLSSFNLFKLCFTSTTTATPTVSRFPLLYKSTNHHHYQSALTHQTVSSCPTGRSCNANMNYSCYNSPAFLVSSSSKRTFAGGVINRYLATPIGNNSSTTTKTALLTYKFENSRNQNNMSRTCEQTTSLMLETNRNGTARSICTTNSCCIHCTDNNNCCDVDDCTRHTSSGKCSSCCTCCRPETVTSHSNTNGSTRQPKQTSPAKCLSAEKRFRNRIPDFSSPKLIAKKKRKNNGTL